ncbi:MAG: ankyrin repeat domain-containing protein [Planctomycetota bacterium]
MKDNAAVFSMVETGDIVGVRAWLRHGGDPNSPQTSNGSLLHYGAMCGHVELIRLLLENGADVDHFDTWGNTPLFAAVSNGHTEAARLLLSRGARLAYMFQVPDNAAERARLAEERDSIRSLMQLPAEAIENMWANRFEPEEMNVIDCCEHFSDVKMLVSEFGADINRINSCGESLLTRFVMSGDVLAVKWMLENGALVDQTSTGGTAVFTAVHTDNIEMIKLLIDAGANVNQDVGDLCVPLLSYTQSTESAKLLLERGANPTLRVQDSFPCWQFVRNRSVQRYLEAAATAWEGTT